ncbi:MAG TPA: 5'-deoxyadenosine deaminase [Vicinamibacterales bacterium]|nr:5'-deoxyadenosine deaminase [Vicinamibacterales bacterium]
MGLALRNATILTMNDAGDVVTGDLWIEGGRIASVGAIPAEVTPETTIDAGGALVLPGFIQTHVHLCQTLFRGAADDLPLLAWLRDRIWPMEAAHDQATLAASARLAAAELLLSGTTTALTMETVHDTDAVFEALASTHLRATIGKCLMNRGDGVPRRLFQSTAAGIDESLALHRRWHGAAGGRLRAALAPRFALSCTRDLLEATAAASAAHGLLVHTHASEQRAEIDLVRRETGMDNIAYFAAVGLGSPRLCAAHCVWPTEAELQLIADQQIKVLHCPGSNLKLGSGVAPIVDMRARGIDVSLGSDGAACNNSLDMFHEMRLAATLQAMRAGPGALPARDVVWMATRGGARALGLDREIGTIAPGYKADLIVVENHSVHHQPGRDPYATLVYSARPTDVRVTIVDGEVVAHDGELSWADVDEIRLNAADAAARLLARV